jgi:amino acid transporter
MAAETDRDAAELAKLGYAQELLRAMGGFQNFALSFSIISILTGGIQGYDYGFSNGGPFVMTVGWPLVTLMTLAVAASLAELASAYPTAGALYHWASLHGGRGWGFLTAWLNTIGQFAITAGIDYGLAELLVDALGVKHNRAHVLPIYAGLLASHAILNHIGVRVVALLNSLSAWYHIAGVALLVGVIVAVAPHHPVGFLFTRATLSSHGYLYGFAIALLQAQWTFTGYDASAHTCEETHDPRRNAPWGIFLSVAVSGIAGYLMLIAITLAVPAGSATPFLDTLRVSVGGSLGTALLWMVMGAMWFCGLGSVTSNSRMLFAFARDGGLPASRAVALVSPRWKTPHVAVWVSAAAAFVVAVWAEAYTAMIALSTIGLYASYGIPILFGMRARGSGRWRDKGPWHLGGWSLAINLLALVWIAIITVLFVLPPNQMAGYMFAGCLAALGLYWFGYMRTRFKGPPVSLAGERPVADSGAAS